MEIIQFYLFFHKYFENATEQTHRPWDNIYIIFTKVEIAK